MMEIEKLLKLEKWQTEKEFIEMILSNRIDYYAGDEIGAAITVKNFGILAEDIIKWGSNKKGDLEELMDAYVIPFPEGYTRINKSGFPRIVWIDNNGGYLTYSPTHEESDKYQRMRAF